MFAPVMSLADMKQLRETYAMSRLRFKFAPHFMSILPMVAVAGLQWECLDIFYLVAIRLYRGMPSASV